MTTPISIASQQPLELLTQLLTGPSFREVAAVLLRQALQARYPTLAIDPDICLIGTPGWEIIDEQACATTTAYRTLSDSLTDQAVLGEPTLYIEGEHFLTQQPLTEPPTHLPVRIGDIAHLLNTLAPVMLTAWQEQQLAFWNKSNGSGPHWHQLSNSLRGVWNVRQAPGWNESDCAMARQLFHAPTYDVRRLDDPYTSHAYLLDIDQVDGAQVTHLNRLALSVLIGKQAGRDVILTHSLLKGYEKFTSLAQLGRSLPARLDTSAPRTQLQWRLFEPDGNFFDYQACSLIALQVEAIGSLDFSDVRHPDTAPPPGATELTTGPGPGREWYQQALPGWLQEASTSDLNFYARHLKDLASLNSSTGGKSYQDDIPPIEQYALNHLKAEILKDHPQAGALALDTLTLKVQQPVVWGTFTVPGMTETTTFNLAELALHNLIAIPVGNKTLQLHNGQNLPDWLTVEYIESLISRVDIGRNYPALIKSKLLEIPREASSRKNLYIQHLRIQLPLLALQGKIQQQDGIDDRGYRYVAALMQAEASDHTVDGQTIVMRPLAFIPQRRDDATADEVENMYVIGPQDPAAGPCLLYRPLFTPALVQYPSPANLMYAIAQSPDLRRSVLAWLPDSARDAYANYVFPGELPSPWAVADFLVDASTLETMSGPIGLGKDPLKGDLLAGLFEANAQALVKLADRQSTSNTENRWATLKQTGWTLLNAALPFTSPSVATGLWIWQIVDQLQQFVGATEQDDTVVQWTTFTDVLLNLSMAITLHISTRLRPRGARPERESRPTEPSAGQRVEIKQLGAIAGNESPPGHTPLLHTSGALNRSAATLGRVLDRFKVSQPGAASSVDTRPGPTRHLTRVAERFYAQVGERWFEVSADDEGNVVIIDPRQPDRTGPPLIHNAAGQWFVDTRLRLRGGGPKRMLNKVEAEATLKAAEVRAKLEAFENAKKTAQRALQQARQAMTDVSGNAAEVKRQHYMDTLDQQSADYEAALQHLKTLSVFTPVPDYQQKALGYIRAQLELTEAAIREAQTTFTPQLRVVLDQLEHPDTRHPTRYVEDARQMTEMSEDMITRLDYTHARFTQLKALAKEGVQLIQSARKKLPAYTSIDLKALQITLARRLCLPEDSATRAPQAWANLNEIVDNADLSVQALRDTLNERSEARLDERIESLSSLIEQFKVLDERLEDFSQEFSSLTHLSPLERLRKQVKDFSRQALTHLSQLHAERDILRNRPTPPPTPPKPLKKFIHTRYNGVMIGEPRLTAVGLETDLVDIKSPLTRQVIATFHEKSPNVWVQRLSPAHTEQAVPELQSSLGQGRTLLDGLPAFKQRAIEQTRQAGRTAVGIEYLYHRHALLLEETSRHIEQALADSTITADQTQSATALGKQLNDAAQDLYRRASESMTRMIKQHPPTTKGVEWLSERDEIVIKKSVRRRRLKSSTPDYLDEYIITERATHQVLWYAHFHYSTDWTPAKAYLSARLKTTHEYRQGSAADSVKGLNEQQQIDYYRSEISLEAAKRLFFDHK
ncbi:hypothetical protein DM05_5343 [Pseudomonas poae]|uniref:Uncharacterized protein n=1 Tax=Pseudomonas poae TaxID=200451 RepID=A0A7Z1GMJ9_9PSED|nr:hypothetical protein [Pseudomonas poae]PFG60623.1 hypothetical protein DM05_5343 [Pseudomonas poae]